MRDPPCSTSRILIWNVQSSCSIRRTAYSSKQSAWSAIMYNTEALIYVQCTFNHSLKILLTGTESSRSRMMQTLPRFWQILSKRSLANESTCHLLRHLDWYIRNPRSPDSELDWETIMTFALLNIVEYVWRPVEIFSIRIDPTYRCIPGNQIFSLIQSNSINIFSQPNNVVKGQWWRHCRWRHCCSGGCVNCSRASQCRCNSVSIRRRWNSRWKIVVVWILLLVVLNKLGSSEERWWWSLMTSESTMSGCNSQSNITSRLIKTHYAALFRKQNGSIEEWYIIRIRKKIAEKRIFILAFSQS